jgi:hypothetical protein
MKIIHAVLVFAILILASCSPGSEKSSGESAPMEEKKSGMHTIEIAQMKFNPCGIESEKRRTKSFLLIMTL